MWLDFLVHKNKKVRIFLFSSNLLFIFGFLELMILGNNYEHLTGSFLRFGFLLFLLILAWDAMRKVADAVKLSKKANKYKLLATKDTLTSCKNRGAYERDMAKIDLNKNITIFMADMNNMKEINDTYGHHAGDQAVILCSQCLAKVFGRRVYRIGGDEFLCIVYDLNPFTAEQIIASFSTECAKENADFPYKFEVSIGFAMYDKSIDHTIFDTVKRADSVMYEMKEKMKHR
jgi:diguanylate cyclase (GGDEF)-like protein